MQSFTDWTLATIRSEDCNLSWLEERKFEWIPLAQEFINRLLSGVTVIVHTDPRRKWFLEYIFYHINKKIGVRPFLPFIGFDSLRQNLHVLKEEQDYDLLGDLLEVSFKSDYIFWYIGAADDDAFKIVRRRDDAFLWAMDAEITNSFFLRSSDEFLDLKLINLLRLLDKTIDAVLFGEVSPN